MLQNKWWKTPFYHLIYLLYNKLFITQVVQFSTAVYFYCSVRLDIYLCIYHIMYFNVFLNTKKSKNIQPTELDYLCNLYVCHVCPCLQPHLLAILWNSQSVSLLLLKHSPGHPVGQSSHRT